MTHTTTRDELLAERATLVVSIREMTNALDEQYSRTFELRARRLWAQVDLIDARIAELRVDAAPADEPFAPGTRVEVTRYGTFNGEQGVVADSSGPSKLYVAVLIDGETLNSTFARHELLVVGNAPVVDFTPAPPAEQVAPDVEQDAADAQNLAIELHATAAVLAIRTMLARRVEAGRLAYGTTRQGSDTERRARAVYRAACATAAEVDAIIAREMGGE